MPLFLASASTWLATSLSWSNGPVVVMANCTGRPDAPGRVGGWKATTCSPAILLTRVWISVCSAVAPRVRSSHGFSTRPPTEVPGTSIWNRLSSSGMSFTSP